MEPFELDYMTPLLARIQAAVDRGLEVPMHLHIGWFEGEGPFPPGAILGAQRQLAERVVDTAGPQSTDRVVDVGCGIGGTLRLMRERLPRAELHGVNRSARQLAVARSLLASHRVDLHHADALALPFDDQSVDQVLAVECAFHFDHRGAFLREAARVLRPGGALTLTDFVAADSITDQEEAWLLDGHSPWPDLRASRPDYDRWARDAGLALTTAVDFTPQARPTFAALRGRDWTTLNRIDRGTAVLGALLDRGALRAVLLRFSAPGVPA